jgi:DNA repair protein RadC
MKEPSDLSCYKIMSWAEEDRPREKFLLKGRSALSDAELLGILIGSGTRNQNAVDIAKSILLNVNNNLNELARLSVHDLEKIRGIGKAKAIKIVSAMELGRRRSDQVPDEKPRISCSEDAWKVIRPALIDVGHEEFWIIVLNRANYVLKTEKVSSGGLSGTVADPKVIFKHALDSKGSSIILVHNHPSGNLKPSEADISLTRKLKESGLLLELPVIDHLIFTDHKYFSFADEGIL